MKKKIIFLDVDGVLNSAKFDREKPKEAGNIDESRLTLLKTLVDKTGAHIVLSSTWRTHLGQGSETMDAEGKALCELLAGYGLALWDATPVM